MNSGHFMLSAIVCTYERYHVLAQSIDALLRQNAPSECYEIIVVDNSRDQAAAHLFGAQYADRPNVRYVLESTPGLSNARNVGTKLATGHIVAFIDDDAVSSPDWVQGVIDVYKTYGARVGVVGGRVVPRWISEKPAWLEGDLLSYLSLIDYGSATMVLGPKQWLAGCNISFDKQALLSAGGFSPALGRGGSSLPLLSGEEIEATRKIRTGGRLTVYTPNAIVEHIIDPARLTQAWFRRRAAWQAVSDLIAASDRIGEPKQMSEFSQMAVERLRALSVGNRDDLRANVFRKRDDPLAFRRDLEAIYCSVIASLSGGIEVEDR